MRLFAGFCYRRNDETAARTILWQQAHERANPGRPAMYRQTEGVGLEPGELNMAVRHRDVWRQTVGAWRAEHGSEA